MKYEVEQKFRLTEPASEVIQRITALGAERGGEIQQADHYFNHPVRDFRTTDEALRIRSVGDQNWLTWKGPKIDSETKTRREIEPALGAGKQTAEQLADILSILGFHSVAVVRKSRKSFILNHNCRTFEFVVDQVDGVGEFVEIELSADDEDLADAQTALKALSQEIGLTQIERRSYLALLLEKRPASAP